MVRYKVSVSDEAKETLRNIYHWLKENESASTAENVKKGLLDEIGGLSQMPDRYGIVQEIKNDQIVFRRILKWAYKIIFVIDEEGLEVLVVDIRHAKQSPERLQEKFGN